MAERPARPPRTPADEAWRGAPDGAHEWMSFPDPDDERTWLFDVTFLESNWTCIFGRGCQGVMTGPAPELVQGCCSYGAHFTGPKDARRVEAAAKTLTPEQWQFYKQGQARDGGRPRVVKRSPKGELSTRLVKDACIFLNRPDFPGGAGCALHRAAMDRGVPHLELKPDVCWQLPLRREDEVADDGYVTSVIRQWDRRDWGPGGDEFHWWCTEDPEAFVGTRPVYEELGPELVALSGRKIYKRLVRYLQARAGRTALNGSRNGSAGNHDGTGHDGTGHDGTGHDGTGHDGTVEAGTGHTGTGHDGTVDAGTGHTGTGHADNGQTVAPVPVAVPLPHPAVRRR